MTDKDSAPRLSIDFGDGEIFGGTLDEVRARMDAFGLRPDTSASGPTPSPPTLAA